MLRRLGRPAQADPEFSDRRSARSPVAWRFRRRVVFAAFAAFALAGVGTAIALAGGRSAPPPEPLDQAIAHAVSGPPAAGITADVTFTSDLFPPGTLLGKLASGLLSGSGHVWLSSDGRGRADLQTGAGEVGAVWDASTLSLYVGALNTIYRFELPAASAPAAGTPPTLAAIDGVLSRIGAEWAISQPQPGVVAGQPAYTVSVAPKQGGSLLDSIGLAFDADHGTPLHAAVYAHGTTSPVLELDVTHVAYGAVPASDLQASFPATAGVTDLGSVPRAESPGTTAVTGLDAVTAAAGFPVVAPESLAGYSRSTVDLRDETVFIRYGQGVSGVVLIERKTAASPTGHGFLDNLPSVTIDGISAHELTTTLGTAITWDAGGTTNVLAGSLPSATLESAVSTLRWNRPR